MAKLGIITGMLFEKGVLNAAARAVPMDQRPLIICCGLGRGAARKAAEEAVANGATALLSFGISAGLDPRLLPGHVVAASYVHDGKKALLSDPAWTDRLREELGRLCRITRDPIAHAHEVLMTPVEKAKVLTQTGASVADMESYAVAETAEAHGLPFTTVRVVADTAHDTLPMVAVTATTPEGGVDLVKSILGALRRPGEIPELIQLGRRTRIAQVEMRRLADFGLPRSFFM
jgi:adenosylhomocysteine nucleosidase